MAFCFFWNIKSLHFTDSHFYSFVLSLAVIHCNSSSFFVTRRHSLSLVATCCTTRCHSFSFVVPLLVIRCISFYQSLSFVVTRWTTRLSFYKRSQKIRESFCNWFVWWEKKKADHGSLENAGPKPKFTVLSQNSFLATSSVLISNMTIF